MLRSIFLLIFTATFFPELSLADGRPQISTSLREVLDAMSSAYNRSPNFNSFYSSDDFSLFVVASRKPDVSWVTKKDIIRHFGLLFEKALDWGSPEERALLSDSKVRSIDELETLLGDQEYKQYSNIGQYGSEYRADTYYVGTDYQLWFEETWVD